MSFLDLTDKTILVTGVANKRSVAAHVGRLLIDEGARAVFSVQGEAQREAVAKLFPGAETFECDVTRDEDLAGLAAWIGERGPLHGLVHSIAFANYSTGMVPFHSVERADFMQALDISCFSLIALCNALKPHFDEDASVVTISISTTEMAAENYGYMAPIKAALDSAVCFLAKSFSDFSRVRFNAVAPGLLKTSASAGIPDYLKSYLFAEACTLRGKGVQTDEVANVVAFMLSARSSGIQAQKLVIDAGMSRNYFNKPVIEKVTDLGR